MTTTQHPERRAVEVGERWLWAGNGKAYTINRSETREGELVWWCNAPGENDGYFRDSVFACGELTLLDVPAAAPLAAVCKAPEGYKLCARNDGKCGRWGTRAYCWQCFAEMEPKAAASLMFRDGPKNEPDWTPPLAAQPAETKPTLSGIDRQVLRKCIGCGAGEAEEHRPTCIVENEKYTRARESAKPTPQPAPAKPHDFSDPYCVARRDVRACVNCGLSQTGFSAINGKPCFPEPGWHAAWEAALSADSDTGILCDPVIPERLERPKLAHIAGMHDDDLVGR